MDWTFNGLKISHQKILLWFRTKSNQNLLQSRSEKSGKCLQRILETPLKCHTEAKEYSCSLRCWNFIRATQTCLTFENRFEVTTLPQLWCDQSRTKKLSRIAFDSKCFKIASDSEVCRVFCVNSSKSSSKSKLYALTWSKFFIQLSSYFLTHLSKQLNFGKKFRNFRFHEFKKFWSYRRVMEDCSTFQHIVCGFL